MVRWLEEKFLKFAEKQITNNDAEFLDIFEIEECLRCKNKVKCRVIMFGYLPLPFYVCKECEKEFR